MMEIRPCHWFVALLLATAVHLAFALSFERPAKPELAGSGVEIHLGAPGGGDGNATELHPMGTAALEEIASSVAESVALESVKALDAVQLEPEALEPEAADAQPVEELLAALAPEMALVPAQPAPDVHATTPPEPTVVPRAVSKPKSKSAKRAKKKRATKRKTNRLSQAKKVGSAATQARKNRKGQGNSRGKDGTGGKRGAGGGAARSNYAGTLAAWLNKHKRYPRRARQLEQQGTTKVRFTIDRNGRLLSFHILKSSGHDLLDREVRAMLRRASPMPVIPKAIAQAELTVTVPISFSLR